MRRSNYENQAGKRTGYNSIGRVIKSFGSVVSRAALGLVGTLFSYGAYAQESVVPGTVSIGRSGGSYPSRIEVAQAQEKEDGEDTYIEPEEPESPQVRPVDTNLVERIRRDDETMRRLERGRKESKSVLLQNYDSLGERQDRLLQKRKQSGTNTVQRVESPAQIPARTVVPSRGAGKNWYDNSFLYAGARATQDGAGPNVGGQSILGGNTLFQAQVLGDDEGAQGELGAGYRSSILGANAFLGISTDDITGSFGAELFPNGNLGLAGNLYFFNGEPESVDARVIYRPNRGIRLIAGAVYVLAEEDSNRFDEFKEESALRVIVGGELGIPLNKWSALLFRGDAYVPVQKSELPNGEKEELGYNATAGLVIWSPRSRLEPVRRTPSSARTPRIVRNLERETPTIPPQLPSTPGTPAGGTSPASSETRPSNGSTHDGGNEYVPPYEPPTPPIEPEKPVVINWGTEEPVAGGQTTDDSEVNIGDWGNQEPAAN